MAKVNIGTSGCCSEINDDDDDDDGAFMPRTAASS
jgi:hypothetical protein